MHVDWNWIKQRPHFIAESLADYFYITLLYPTIWNKKKAVINQKVKKIIYNKIYHLPYKIFPFKKLNIINSFIIYIQMKLILIRKNYEIIWFTSPLFYNYIDNLIEDKIVVYDCMDKWPGFAKNKEEYYEEAQQEKRLIDRSDIIFVSSDSLYNYVIKEAKDKKVILLKNAISYSFLQSIYSNNDNNKMKKKEFLNDGYFKLGYIGTIDRWIDFKSMVSLLDEIDNLIINLVGPVCCKIPAHQRLKIYGPINHEKIPNIISQFDGFIIPFILNELTEAVNPVKIYEYISFGKPIISVKYDQIEEFEKFIWTYSSYQELKDIIINLIKKHLSVKYSKIEAFEFLKDNTWEKRGAAIIESLFKANLI